jgi:hypothetical protein
MGLRNDLSKFISRWFDSGEIAEVFTTFTDQTEPEVVKRAWQRLFYGASSLQCVQWHAFLVERRDLAKGGNVKVTESRAKKALLAIQSFSNGSSPSAEAGCLDAVARSLGISDLIDTAHISHLLDFVSYLRGYRAEQNALTRECLRGTWATQGSNEDLRQLAERNDAEYRAQLYATAYYAMHQDKLAVQFLLHVSNHAQGESDIDSMRLSKVSRSYPSYARSWGSPSNGWPCSQRMANYMPVLLCLPQPP